MKFNQLSFLYILLSTITLLLLSPKPVPQKCLGIVKSHCHRTKLWTKGINPLGEQSTPFKLLRVSGAFLSSLLCSSVLCTLVYIQSISLVLIASPFTPEMCPQGICCFPLTCPLLYPFPACLWLIVPPWPVKLLRASLATWEKSSFTHIFGCPTAKLMRNDMATNWSNSRNPKWFHKYPPELWELELLYSNTQKEAVLFTQESHLLPVAKG